MWEALVNLTKLHFFMGADKSTTSQLATLLADKTYLNIPKAGDVVKGRIVAVTKNEVRIDVENYRTGVVRGREIADPSRDLEELKVGDEVEATVVDLENENGEVELSFRFAGHRKAWDTLIALFRSGEPVPVKVLEASKGGLLVRVNNIPGFLPVSQLSPDNYPRVSGGDKQKILEKLKSFVGKPLDVRVLDVNEADEKLIVSEKAVWEQKQKDVISKFKVGDIVEGQVSAITDFGAFIKFDILEGLVHISEIAWQRIDHPSDVLKIGDTVKTEIVDISGSKVFLSMKKLTPDPWKNIGDKYKVGQVVTGKILKANPFGFFVELDPEIHGLAHISELSKKPVKDMTEVAKVGETRDFMIVSVEPEQHRLGLSIKALTEKEKENEKPAEKKAKPVEEDEMDKKADEK